MLARISLLLLLPAFAFAAPFTPIDGGLLLEAEAYDGRVFGQGFGEIIDEPLGSGEKVIIGMWREGAVSFELAVPDGGPYAIWLRYAAPGDAPLRFALDTIDREKMTTVTVPKTLDNLSALGAYQWARIGEFELTAGTHLFIVGTGALRHDCYFFTRDLQAQVSDDVLEHLRAQREATKGQLLPELIHDRTITEHPEWLKHALRPCYAHFEWDREITADEWCRHAAEAGANCIIGAGEVPAGSLDGRIRPFGYRVWNQDPEYQFPEGYDLSYGWAKEYCDAAHAHGLKIALYGGAFRSLDPLLVEHPEWRQVDAKGRPYPHGFASWHSPYRQAYIDRWVKIAELSGMDGIMIDMLFTGPSGGDYSEYTVSAFKEKFGVEPPREPDFRNLTWQRWIDFQNWTREEMLLDLTEALHEVNPECAVIINQTEGWIFNQTERNFLTSRVGQCVDGLLEEMGWDYRHHWTRPWAWPLSSAWQNLYLHCRTRPGYGQMWHMILNFPLAHVEALSYSMLANGTAPAVVTGGNWPEMTKVWEHTKACEPWVEETQLVPWMALHFGEDTLDWYANAKGEDTYMAYMESVFGVFRAALELHLPVEIITDDDLTDPAKLRRYATLCLPNSACLSDAQAAAIDEYVRAGGGLMATYETGRYDENGTERERGALADLFGVEQYGPVSTSSWLLPLHEETHPIMDHPDIMNSGAWHQGQSVRAQSAVLYSGPPDRLIGCVPTSRETEGTTGIRIGGTIPRGARVPEGAVYRAFIARPVDAGKVVYFPVDIGHAFYVFNHPLNRRLIGQALEWSAAYPLPFRTDALMSTQTVPYSRGEARVVHLVNDNSSFGRAAAPNPEAFTAFRAEVAPVREVRVGVQGEFARARLFPDGTDLPVTQEDGFTYATAPQVDVHAVVVFEQ